LSTEEITSLRKHGSLINFACFIAMKTILQCTLHAYLRSSSSTTNEIKMATKTDVIFVQIVITVTTESDVVFENYYTEEYIHKEKS
jgi:hypothetical protein